MNLIADELTGFASIGVLGRRLVDGRPFYDAGDGWTEATSRNLVELGYDVRHWNDGPLSPAQRADWKTLRDWAWTVAAPA